MRLFLLFLLYFPAACLFAQETLPLTVPGEKSAQELLDYAQAAILARKTPPDLDRQKALKEVVDRSTFLLAIAEAALARNPQDTLKPKIYMLKFEALEHLARTNDPKWVADLEAWLDELDRLMPKSREAKMARVFDLRRLVGVFLGVNRSESDFQRIKKTVLDLILQEPLNVPPTLPRNLLDIAGMAEQVLEKPDLVETTGRELLAILEASDDPGLQSMVKPVQAAAHVLGQNFELEGVTLAGEPFDLKKWRGKVVLVDFFTSWCLPCIEEFPSLIELYKRYHDMGFEIVGIGVDEAAKIQKIVDEHKLPWPVVSEELTLKNKMPSLEKRYFIRKFPTVFLIGRDGKLIDAHARGRKLEKMLEELFAGR